MTREQFDKIFENDSKPWEGDNCLQGLNIIAKYTDNVVQGAGCDAVWSEDVDKLIELGITVEDAEKLRDLNWSVEDNEYLMCFV